MVAGGSFDSWSFRNNLDVSIPMYSPLSEQNLLRAQVDINEVINSKRSQMITTLQSGLIEPEKQLFLKNWK